MKQPYHIHPFIQNHFFIPYIHLNLLREREREIISPLCGIWIHAKCSSWYYESIERYTYKDVLTNILDHDLCHSAAILRSPHPLYMRETLQNMQETIPMGADYTSEEELDSALTQLIIELGEVLARLRFAETVEFHTCEQYVHSINFLKKAHPSPQHMKLLTTLLALSQSHVDGLDDDTKE